MNEWMFEWMKNFNLSVYVFSYKLMEDTKKFKSQIHLHMKIIVIYSR